MKSILQPIKPQYCELIASGKKTIEVRKTRPKLDTPFKVYIYCTKDKTPFLLPTYSKGNLTDSDIWQNGNGKVIGEYVCDKIEAFFPSRSPYETDSTITKASCLSIVELIKYSNMDKPLYAWHISDLKIYDKPKELYDFIKPCTDPYQYCQGCEHGHNIYPCDMETYEDLSGCCFDTVCLNRIRKAPQSWCYVEEVS